jgi:hypothetical protein
MPDIFDQLTASPGGDIFDRLTGVGEQARQRLAAQGINPDVPVDPEANRGPGFFQGLVDSIVPSRETALSSLKAINIFNPVGQAEAIYDMGKGVVSGQIDQMGKAKGSYLRGDIVEGMGHAAAGAMPLIGPAAAQAGEQIAEGNIGYGLGQAAGLVGQVLAPAVGPARARQMQPRAPEMVKAAESQYASVFSKGQRPLAESMAPEMMNRRMVVKDPKLMMDEADAAASAIDVDAMVSQAAQSGQTVPLQPIIQRIDKAIADEFHAVNGQQVPKSPESQHIVDSLAEYKTILTQHAPNGVIDPVQALELRRTWEAKPGERGYFTNPNAKISDPMAVRMEAANAVRPELNALPEVGAANAEKSFQLNVKKLGNTAPQGKLPYNVMEDAGKTMAFGTMAHFVPGVGNLIGGGVQAFAMMKALRDLPKTPQWKTASAIAKRDFAKSLASGDVLKAREIAAGITSGALISDDYGHKAATEQLKAEAAQAGPPEVARQIVAGKRAVYEDPSGKQIPVPAGIMSAFAQRDYEHADSPINKWLEAMGKQKKIQPGGQLRFVNYGGKQANPG